MSFTIDASLATDAIFNAYLANQTTDSEIDVTQDITLGAVSEVDDQGDPQEPNAEITLTGVQANGFIGSKTVQYRRVSFANWYYRSGSPRISMGDASTTVDLLAELNTAMGTALVAGDITSAPVTGDETVVNITIADSNKVWLPETIAVRIAPPQIVLGDGNGNALGDGNGNLIAYA